MTIAFQNSSFINGGATATAGTYSNGVNWASFYNTDALDNKFNYNDTKEGYEMTIAGRDAAIQETIDNIGIYLGSGEEDKALEAYNELLSEMSSQGRYAKLITEDGNDRQLRAVAKGMIEGQIGCKLEDYIDANASSYSTTQAQNILWGSAHSDTTSKEDLLEKMCNIKTEKTANPIKSGLAIIASPVTRLGNLLFGNPKH